MPRRYDDDDDLDDLPIRRDAPLTGMDAFFANTNTVVLVIFGLCCGCIPLVLSIIGLAICKDEKARSNATLLLIVSIVGVVAAAILQVMQGAMQQGGGGRF